VIGEPEIIRSSGNPFYDDNAKRAILKSSPLPAPPKAGKRSIIFTPEE
jgi:TonB family protein